MVKASVNAQDHVSNHWDRVARPVETSSLILGQFVTLRVRQTMYQRETQRRRGERSSSMHFRSRSRAGLHRAF